MSADGNNHHEPTWQLSTREIALIFAFWTSLAALSVLNRLYDPRGEGLRVITRTGPLVLPFLEAWLWAALTPLIFWVSSRTAFHAAARRLARVGQIVFVVIAGIAIALFVDFTLDLVRDLFFPLPRRRAAAPCSRRSAASDATAL